MNINTANVTYSSIVAIGEEVNLLEKNSGDKYLKLHRGVMDVCDIDLNKLNIDLNLNDKKTQQYGGNDGSTDLINTIKTKFKLNGDVIITPGGMAALDLLINSLSEYVFHIPTYHWGSWNKILKTHNKWLSTFDDMDLENFKPTNGVVMLCYPSNPTGYCPDINIIKNFLTYSKNSNITVILDLPYYFLYNNDNELSEFLFDNVILVSSFSKSIGLSGYRIGYTNTRNSELFKTLRIRSLYKYNSISTLPQYIINELLLEDNIINEYKNKTIQNISNNIKFLKFYDFLYDGYKSDPIGPFAIVKLSYSKLIENKISSVPLSKFTLDKIEGIENLSRISLAVDHDLFTKYFKSLI